MTSFSVDGLTSLINQVLPEPHAGLLAGLLFGTKMTVSKALYGALVSSGTIHIIALSGMNITIMEDLVGKLLLPWVGRRLASVITLGVICWFVWFVGPSSSIVRAAIMGSLTLIAVLFGRQYWALLSWALAVGIMVAINFSWLFEISFQLSALATLGIILFGGTGDARRGTPTARISPRMLPVARLLPDVTDSERSLTDTLSRSGGEEHWWGILRAAEPVWNALKENLHLTLAAQVFTIPLILFHFHRISLIAPLTNLAIGWVIAPLTLLGWMTVLVGFLVPPVSYIAGWIAWLFLEYIIRMVQVASFLPFASIQW